MFFEDDEKDIENSWDDVNLDDNDDEDAVTWDELLGEEGSDLMSVKPNGEKEEHAPSESEDIIDFDNEDDFSSLMEEADREIEPTGSISDKEKELINLDSDEGYIDGEVYADVSSDEEDKNFISFEDEDEIPQQKTQSAEEDAFLGKTSQEKISQSMPSPEISLEESDEDLYEQNFEEKVSNVSPIGLAPKASKETGGSKTPVVLGLVAAVFIVCLAGICIYIFKNSGGIKTAKDFDPKSLEQNLEEKQPQDMMPAGENPQGMQQGNDALGTGDPFQQPGQKPEEKEKIVMEVINTGRANPFIPASNFGPAGYTVPAPVDILAPPEVLSEENKISTIKVSGILFDSVKPSAIINVGDVDHFVQKGDTIDEYVVADITKTDVVIRSGKNVYKAAIGQVFNTKPQHIDGQTNYVYNKNSKTISRQYFSPTDVVVNVKDDKQGQGQGQSQSQN